MASSPSARRPKSPLPLTPALRVKRAIDYWHKHGKFAHDQLGYDPATGLVHKPTSTHLHKPNTTLTNTGDVVTVYTPRTEDDLNEGADTTSPRTPYFLRSIVKAEAEDRTAQGVTPKDYGNRWQSAYRDQIGDTPVCRPGDHKKAELYWYKIKRALEQDDWTPAERNRLYLLENKWRRRKDGNDPRFEVVGNLRGSPNPDQKREIHDRRILENIRQIARGKGGA
jgi:hypothetical protein